MWEKRLKQYDRRLYSKKKLDGSIGIYRESPFSSRRQHLIWVIGNQKPGRWVIDKIMMMDTQRRNIVGDVADINKRIYNKRDDPRATKEIAELFHTGGSIFLN